VHWECAYFDAEITSIDVVTEEQIPRLGGITTHLEQLHQVKVLSVHITTDRNGGVHFEHIWFGGQNLCTLADDPKGLLFGKAAFATKMLFEEMYVGLGSVCCEELLLCRDCGCRCLNI
jgi:hypothetical protein